MGRRLRQAKVLPKKLLEKWRLQLFEGPLERSPAAKSKPGFVAAAPSKRRQTHQCDQRRHARGVSKSKWLQVPNRQRMLQRQEGQTATLQRCTWLRCCGGNAYELRSLSPTGYHLEQSQRPPDAQPRRNCQVKNHCNIKIPIRNINIYWVSIRPLPYAIF